MAADITEEDDWVAEPKWLLPALLAVLVFVVENMVAAWAVPNDKKMEITEIMGFVFGMEI